MKHRSIFWAVTMLLLALPSMAQTAKLCTLKSPDGKATVTVETLTDGVPSFSLTVDGTGVISQSRMAFRTAQGNVPGTGWQQGKLKKSKHKGVWKPIWGKRAVVPEVYNAVTIP